MSMIAFTESQLRVHLPNEQEENVTFGVFPSIVFHFFILDTFFSIIFDRFSLDGFAIIFFLFMEMVSLSIAKLAYADSTEKV